MRAGYGQETWERWWPGLEPPQAGVKTGLIQETAKIDRGSVLHLQEELQRGKKLLDFKLIETAADFLL